MHIAADKHQLVHFANSAPLMPGSEYISTELADDMGLGKTVQVLAFLHILKSGVKNSVSPHRASLLVIPASLISNWVNEISHFSPEIEYFIAHPAANSAARTVAKDKRSLNTFDLVITTYALVQKYKAYRYGPDPRYYQTIKKRA